MQQNEFFDRAWLEIDFDRLHENLNEVRSHLSSGCRVMAVMKANAYGHGAVPLAKYLERQEGVTHFATASLSEALALREGGITGEILVLSYTVPALCEKLIENGITQAISSGEHAAQMSEIAAKHGKRLLSHIKLDTGMTRLGFDCRNEAEIDAAASVYFLPGLKITGTFSHFASSDDSSAGAEDYCSAQIERFTCVTEALAKRGIDVGVRHICNTGGIQKYPEAHFDMVRCGAVMYGYGTAFGIEKWNVKPVMSLKAIVTSLREIAVGTPVSYSRKFIAEKPTRVAVLSIGYADGYPRILSGKGKVMLNGCWARQIGNVCMDQMMVDITDIPNVNVGDAAVLIGQSGGLCQTADDLGEQSLSCMHEILSRMSLRLQRLYYKDGKLIGVS